MKFLILLAALVSLALALDPRADRPHKKTTRPSTFSGVVAMTAARKPSGAPSDYKTGLGSASRTKSKAGLKKLPAEFIDAKKRWDVRALLSRQSTAMDFFECQQAVCQCLMFGEGRC